MFGLTAPRAGRGPRSVQGAQPVKIERIEAIPYAIPYTHPLKFASGEVSTADHVLIRIQADGLTGIADAPPRPYTYGETQTSIVTVVETIFAPQLIGLDPLDRGKIHAVLNRTIDNQAAKGAVDIALWDLIGKSLGHAGPQAARRLYGRHARQPHARLPAGAGAARRGAAVRGGIRHHHVQAQGRPAAALARRRGLPGSPRGPRRGCGALSRRQPRLDRQ